MRVVFETPRLLIRCYTPNDAAQAFAIYSNPEVMRFLGAGGRKPVESVEAMRQRLIEGIIPRYEKTPQFGMWAADRKDGGGIVGSILLKDLDGQDEIEVGWHLARESWGNGYATEGAREAIDYGFRVVKLPRIVAVVHSENHKSIAVTKRLGMKHEGKHYAYGLDLEYFSVLPRSHGR